MPIVKNQAGWQVFNFFRMFNAHCSILFRNFAVVEAKDKITEQPSRFDHLEQMPVGELLRHINEEDAVVAEAVRKAIPETQNIS